MSTTIKTKTPFGLSLEVGRFKTVHQEWMTKSSTKKHQPGQKKSEGDEGLDDAVAACIVEYGGIQNPTVEQIQKMPSNDFKFALLLIRYLTIDKHFSERYFVMDKIALLKDILNDADNLLDKEYTIADLDPLWERFLVFVHGDEYNISMLGVEVSEKPLAAVMESLLEHVNQAKDELSATIAHLPPHKFKFVYEFKEKDAKGNVVKFSKEYELELYMSDAKIKRPAIQFSSYDEMVAGLKRETKLEISGRILKYNILTVGDENARKGSITRDNININTSLEWRNPMLMEGNTPINIKTRVLDYMDTEQFREESSNLEGKVETIITVVHPKREEDVIVDYLTQPSFLFPSGVLS